LLSGGISRGHITQIVGPSSSGKTSLLLSILAQATARGEWVAYIDPFSSLDPAFAQKAGIDLKRLLWIRGPKRVFKALDILVGAGGFGVVVLDLVTQGETMNPRILQRTPFAVWFRLKRAARQTSTTLLILGQAINAGSAVSRVISLKRRETQWSSTTDKTRDTDSRHARLLLGICNELELLRGKDAHANATFYCHFQL
jgi:ABC-type cobalamin/Fe3+-siderophores transport system ATPase subunit